MLSAVALAQRDSTKAVPLVPPMPQVRYPLAGALADSGQGRPVQAFDPDQLAKLRASRDFEYERETAEGLSPWQRFLRWLRSLVPELDQADEAQSTNLNKTWTWVVRIIAALVLVFAITKLLGIDIPFNLDLRGKKTVAATPLPEDIHNIDFAQMIGQALGQGDFRLAVRLHYLQLLKQLTDQGLITWRNWKTNEDYAHEVAALRNTDLRLGFNQATLVFDYVWYGHFEVDAQNYPSLKALFERFGNQITKIPTKA
jgi:hypothetical protein